MNLTVVPAELSLMPLKLSSVSSVLKYEGGDPFLLKKKKGVEWKQAEEITDRGHLNAGVN